MCDASVQLGCAFAVCMIVFSLLRALFPESTPCATFLAKPCKSKLKMRFQARNTRLIGGDCQDSMIVVRPIFLQPGLHGPSTDELLVGPQSAGGDGEPPAVVRKDIAPKALGAATASKIDHLTSQADCAAGGCCFSPTPAFDFDAGYHQAAAPGCTSSGYVWRLLRRSVALPGCTSAGGRCGRGRRLPGKRTPLPAPGAVQARRGHPRWRKPRDGRHVGRNAPGKRSQAHARGAAGRGKRRWRREDHLSLHRCAPRRSGYVRCLRARASLRARLGSASARGNSIWCSIYM